MSKYLLTDGLVTLGGYFVGAGTTFGTIDLSNHSFSLDVPLTREQVDVSGFSPTGAKEFLAGQRDERITVGILQDFGTNLNIGTWSVDQALSTLYTSGSSFLITVRPTSGTVSTTNPTYSGTVTLFDYNPLAGSLNARGETNVTFIASTSAGIVRTTS
jgi:hypothetical protein